MAVAIPNLLDHQIYTFDVWNTLIKANLDFSRIRTEAIAVAYDISFDEAKETYTSVKHFLDQSAEIAGICMSTPQCWQLLDSTIQRLRRKKGQEPAKVIIETLIDFCNDAFRLNLPVFTEETKLVLLALKGRGHKLGIISNTNFIAGHILYDELFKELDVFDTVLFSDNFGHAKPHYLTFRHVDYQLQIGGDDSIVHVGDNLICDGGAANVSYFNFQHVENPSNLVEIFKQAGL